MAKIDKETIEKWEKAGRIAAEARDLAAKLCKPGARTVDIAQQVEAFIKKEGALPGFPANISINTEAAHSTPETDTTRIIEAGDVVKLDFGAQVDGYIADNAMTVSDDKDHHDLVNVTKKAVDAALKLAKPGAQVDEISTVIESTIRDEGFLPIINLTGHTIERYTVHAGVEIPNVNMHTHYELQEGEVIAIEPFATDGEGKIFESDHAYIFRLIQKRNVRSPLSMKLQTEASQFKGIPFCQRWTSLTPAQFRLAARELLQRGALYAYPVLKEQGDGLVSQHEHTVMILDKPKVITKI